MENHPGRKGRPSGRGRRVVAVVLSLIQPGAGHFLLGEFRRGIVWTVGLAVVVLIGFVLWFAMPMSFVLMIAAIVVVPVTRVACAIDTLRVAVGRPRWAIVLLGWGALVVLNVLTGPVKNYYRENYVQAFTIPSAAMMDTLLVGDYIVVDKSTYRTQEPRRGDIVVFTYPLDDRRTFIHRIIGMPGDVVHIRGQKVFINSKVLEEPYVRRDGNSQSTEDSTVPALCSYAYGCDPLVVPADSYFVMGDNRNNAQDSRYWGFVKRERIKGRPREIYWSWDSDQHWLRAWRLGRAIL